MPQLRELTTARLNLGVLAKAIDATCETHGLSRRQAALHLGLAPSTLTRIRQGKRPDAEALAVLTVWTDTPLAALLPPDDPAKRSGESLAAVSDGRRGP